MIINGTGVLDQMRSPCGGCGASPSVGLKPTAVRVMANRVRNRSSGRTEMVRTAEQCSGKLLSTLTKWLQNLPIIADREKGQKIR